MAQKLSANNYQLSTIVHRVRAFIQGIKKEVWVCIIFAGLFAIVIGRLVQLQILDRQMYERKLIDQHYQHINVKAKRGNIFVESPSGQPVQLTANSNVYDVFVDPKFITDPDKASQELTPIIVQHLCPLEEGNNIIDPLACLQRLEIFTDKTLLPNKPSIFYLGSGIVATSGLDIEGDLSVTGLNDIRNQSAKLMAEYQSGMTEYNSTLAQTLSGLQYAMVKQLVFDQLKELVFRGIKPRNFLVYLEDPELRADLEKANLPYIQIEGNYAYVKPLSSSEEINKAGTTLYNILSQHQIILSYRQIRNILSPQENRYVKIASNVDQTLVTKLKQLQEHQKMEKQKELAEKRKNQIKFTQDDMVPLLHGLGFEQKSVRQYPFGSFAAHALGYVDNTGKPLYGVEEYRDEYLKGKDGQIIGFGGSWLSQGGADDIQLSSPTNGADITLTLEPNIQKKAEELTKNYLTKFRADSISIIVMNPYDGNVAALANAPDYDPNHPENIYKTEPLGPEYSKLLDDPQYMDIPVYTWSGGKMLPLPFSRRSDYRSAKYINSNYFGPLTLIDKNTTLAYEPGSIFKPLTVGIALDIDEISLYDTYYDKGELQVGDYFIKNVSRDCLGTNTFLHALQFSCNIGTIHVIQKIGKHVFYNYLEKMGLGKVTGIEIAGEIPGSIPDSQIKEQSRFFNNSFGQGLLVTPIQMAVAYSALVNGGYLVKPSIIKHIKLADGSIKQLAKPAKKLIFKPTTTELIKTALYEVVNAGQIKKFAIRGKSLAGKTGTSEIPYRGKYQNGVGRTNGSFAGIITKNNTKYVIVIQVRRPRLSQWGENTAGEIYGEIAKFLVDYEDIEN